MLRVGRRLLVVADGGGQMNTLSEITDADEVAALLGQLAGRSGRAKFGSVFGKMRRSYEADEDGGPRRRRLAAVAPRPVDRRRRARPDGRAGERQ